jgi:hypothetical protein
LKLGRSAHPIWRDTPLCEGKPFQEPYYADYLRPELCKALQRKVGNYRESGDRLYGLPCEALQDRLEKVLRLSDRVITVELGNHIERN